jgi:hypothetical protein
MAYVDLPYRPDLYRPAAAEFTRPANTTAYAALDAVGVTAGSVLTFANVARQNSGSGRVVAVRLWKSDITVTNASFLIHFYNAAPTAIADNSPWTMLYADREKYVGAVATGTMVTGGTGSGGYAVVPATTTPLVLPFKTAAGAKSLFAVITAAAAYTPASAETFSLSITVERL